MPSTELLSQASWNVCPSGGWVMSATSSSCYFASDQTFDRLAGSTSVVIPDCPDGNWVLQVNQDIFDKVGGAVRIVPLLQQAALAAKVDAALVSAAVQRRAEAATLEEVVVEGLELPLVVLNDSLAAAHEAALANAANNLETGVWSSAAYLAAVTAEDAAWEAAQADLLAAAAGCPSLTIYDPSLPSVNISAATCTQYANLTATAEQVLVDELKATIAGRLVPAQAAGAAALAAALQSLQSKATELYTIVSNATGQDASNPGAAAVSVLASYYVEGPASSLSPEGSALTTLALSAPNITAADLAARAETRLAELDAATVAVATLPEVQLAANLTAAGLDPSWYSYVEWSGSPSAYETCNLER